MAEPAGEIRKEYGPYEVEAVLGRGAMGMVYLARDRRIGRKVALKTVHVEERFDDESEANEFYKRLQREAELCGSLQHPNIVTLYEPGYDNNIIAWMATEYVDGESLRDRLKKRKPLPLNEALRIGADLLRGLAFAHSKGIIHRDIKPANILITAAGQAKLADFGIARPVDSNLTQAGEMLGTPSYMSPEQVKCTAVTARSDLFSVGAVLYEMAAGVKAFAASDVSSILKNVVEMEPKPAHAVHPQVPPPLSAIIARLLAKKPEDRYPSAAAALHEIETLRAQLFPDDNGVEDIAASAALPAPPLSTMAGRNQAAPTARDTHPSVTAISTGDFTPAITPSPHYIVPFDRPIPAAIFFGIIGLLALTLGGSALAIRMRTDPSPTAVVTPEQLVRFAEKDEQLRAARNLYSSGDYVGAVKTYDDFISRYPENRVAPDERAEAQLALEAQAKSAVADVRVNAKRPAKKTPVKKAPEEKRPWWRRLGRG